MKRLTTAIAILAIILCFTACGKADLQAGQPNIEPTTENSIILYNTAPVYETFAKLKDLHVWISEYTYEEALLPDEIHYSIETIDKSKIQKLQSNDDIDDFVEILASSFYDLPLMETIVDEIIDYTNEEDYEIDYSIWPENFNGFEYYGQVLSEDADVSDLFWWDLFDYNKSMWYTELPYGKTLLNISNRSLDREWLLLYAANGQLEAIASYNI